MAELMLVRQNKCAPAEKERAALQQVLYGYVDGLAESDKRSWRRMWNRLMKSEPGEMFQISKYEQRVGKFHRMHMATTAALFQAQEQFDSFEVFRDWGKIMAGFVVWCPGGQGELIPIPKSISYSKCSEDEMREFHLAWIGAMQTVHACRFLWPHLTKRKAAEMMDAILLGINE